MGSDHCPVGVDPMYHDSGDVSVHVTTVTFAIYDSWCQEALTVEPYYLRRQLLSEDHDFAEEEVSVEAFAAEQRRRLLGITEAGGRRRLLNPAPTAVPQPAPSAWCTKIHACVT